MTPVPGAAGLHERFERVLARIEHPARLVGGEVNASAGFTFAPEELRVVLAFPDAYEVGISNQALQILYHVARETPGVGVERAYLPWVDALEALRSEGVPLLTLETWTPVADAHLLGVTLQHELNFTNLLELLDLAALPVWAREREDRHPLVVAGGPATAGFAPVAPFLDALVVGDGEDAFGEVLEVVAAAVRRGLPPRRALRELAAVEGVYVPGVSGRVRRRVREQLAGAPYPADCVVPVTGGVHDRAWVEVMRGCSRGCRYCQAGMWYRPVRERPPVEVVNMVVSGLAATGHDEVSLGSLSTTDYSGIEAALEGIAVRTGGEARVNLPSLRVDSAAVRLGHLTSPTSPSITLAPEAGSQRLRDVINKNIDEDQILQAVDEAARLGHTTFKLYFMMGLPTETDEDVAAIVELCRTIGTRARRALGPRAGRLRLNVSVSTFIPKPFTPFQWAAMVDRATAQRRQALLRTGLRRVASRLSLHDVDSSYLEAALARGGEDLAPVIYDAWRRGARYDSWTEQHRPDAWAAAFAAAGVSAEALATTALDPGAPVPWDIIDGVVETRFLREEWERALRGETTEDCRWAACTDCGACGPGLGVDLRAAAEGAGRLSPASSWPEAAPAAPYPEGTADGGRWVLTFSAHGPARLLAHLDTVEVIRRALRRAGARLAVTQGLRPKPRVAVALPRAVGVVGRAELAEFHLEEPPPDDLAARLDEALPAGFAVVALEPMAPGPSIASRVIACRYDVDAAWIAAADQAVPTAAELAAAVRRYTALSEMVVERVRPGGRTTLDVKAFVPTMTASVTADGAAVAFETSVGPTGTARPEDLVLALSILLDRPLAVRRATRTAIVLRRDPPEETDAA